MGTYHHGDLRAALVAEGMSIVERDGVAALSLRAAARAVGVSHSAPGRHFVDATAFLAAIAAAGYRDLAARLAGDGVSATGPADADAALLAAGRAYVDFALDRPEIYRVIFHPALADAAESDPELSAASEAAYAVLCGHVEHAIAHGVVAERPLGELALTLWSAVHGVCSLLIDRQVARKGFAVDGRTVADVVLANVFLGLRA